VVVHGARPLFTNGSLRVTGAALRLRLALGQADEKLTAKGDPIAGSPLAVRRRRGTRALCAAVCVLLLALAATGAASAATASNVVYYGGTAYQPKSLPIRQHGYYRHVSLHNLVWAGWGEPQATAQGTFTYQFCVEENCSTAVFFDEPAVVVLAGVESCRGRMSYTTLALTINGSMPDESFKGYRTTVAACRRRHSSGR
jgi:hypothetical protein